MFKRLSGEQSSNFSFHWNSAPHAVGESRKKIEIYCLQTVAINVTFILLQRNLPERPPLVSDHLTKIPIGSSVSQIAISETSRKRPPLATT